MGTPAASGATAGKPNFSKYKAAAEQHPIEAVGVKLRKLMPWFQTDKTPVDKTPVKA